MSSSRYQLRVRSQYDDSDTESDYSSSDAEELDEKTKAM